MYTLRMSDMGSFSVSSDITLVLGRIDTDTLKVYLYLANVGGDVSEDVLSNVLSISVENVRRALDWLCVEGFLVKAQDDRSVFIGKVKDILEITALDKKHLQFFENLYVKNVDISLIREAKNQALASIGSVSLSYIECLLTYWTDNGIDTASKIKKEDTSSKKAENKKQTSYDLDEWERFAMNFDPASIINR